MKKGDTEMTIERFYAKEAPSVAQMSELFQQKVLEKCMGMIKSDTTSDSLVLDLGIGLGYNLDTLYRSFSNIVAIDISCGALRQSKKNHTGIEIGWVAGDIQNLPFVNNSVDIIICTYLYRSFRACPGYAKSD